MLSKMNGRTLCNFKGFILKLFLFILRRPTCLGFDSLSHKEVTMELPKISLIYDNFREMNSKITFNVSKYITKKYIILPGWEIKYSPC